MVVLAILGKGGVGKTTLAANLAAAVAEKGVSTIVADFDIITGDLAEHFAIKDTKVRDELSKTSGSSIHDLIAAEDLTQEVLNSCLVEVSRNLRIVPSIVGASIELLARVFSSSDIVRTVRALSELCELLVLDFASLDPYAVVALPACTHALLVVDNTPSSRVVAERAARACEVAGTFAVGYVLCKSRYASENIAGLSCLAVLPHDDTLLKHYGKGLPFMTAPGSPYVQKVRELARLLVGEGKRSSDG